MRKHVGIDLGTTNSAICSFDGLDVTIHKSLEQNDVTPSAIFIDKKGKKIVGAHAYRLWPTSPGSAATDFKKMMGTNTPIRLSAVNLTMSPEECSTEILKVLFSYLPEEIRNNRDTGVVITVPAAFNLMAKDATMSAAEGAGLGNVALMQEPVAAVMAVMRRRKGDGVFLVYDLGGGTLDIAIAQSIAGRVSLLSHAGIAMCGGSNFDRILFDEVVEPSLLEEFDLPEDLRAAPEYDRLVRMATRAGETAKIALSANEEVSICLEPGQLERDRKGKEIYPDIPLRRQRLDELIAPRVDETIEAAREALEKAGLTANDVERIVFVGGPTQYKPLRDKVASALGIASSTEVNAMTAVAEGAAVYAESVDWASKCHARKPVRGTVSVAGATDLAFNYLARTPATRTIIAAKIAGPASPGGEFQIDSLDTGWSSGRIKLEDGASVEVALPKPGENTFKVWVFDSVGRPVTLMANRLTITRTAATIDAIPASSSIAIEVLDKLGGSPVSRYLIEEGDPLPKKGKVTLKAGVSLRAGSTTDPLIFNMWEGEKESPIHDREFVGAFKIEGTDFAEGVISTGAELLCEYEALDSGVMVLDVSVPSVGATYTHNFYSRQEGQKDWSNASSEVIEETGRVRDRVEALAAKVDNPKLDQALEKLDAASTISPDEADPVVAKEAMQSVVGARKLLGQVRKEHLNETRQMELDQFQEHFADDVRKYSKPVEASAIDNLIRTAQRAIGNKSPDFENLLGQLRGKTFDILWREDWFVIARFKWLAGHSYQFPDRRQHAKLVAAGEEAVRSDDIARLRIVIGQLYSLKPHTADGDEALSPNVILG